MDPLIGYTIILKCHYDQNFTSWFLGDNDDGDEDDGGDDDTRTVKDSKSLRHSVPSISW